MHVRKESRGDEDTPAAGRWGEIIALWDLQTRAKVRHGWVTGKESGWNAHPWSRQRARPEPTPRSEGGTWRNQADCQLNGFPVCLPAVMTLEAWRRHLRLGQRVSVGLLHSSTFSTARTYLKSVLSDQFSPAESLFFFLTSATVRPLKRKRRVLWNVPFSIYIISCDRMNTHDKWTVRLTLGPLGDTRYYVK